MTVEEMIIEVWEASGRFSDLNPYNDPPTNNTFDLTTSGAQRILNYLNRGYMAVTSWKYPNGRQIRFPINYSKIYFTATSKTVTIDSVPSHIVLDASTPVPADDAYNGWFLETADGQRRIISDSVAATDAIYVSKAFDTAPSAGEDLTLYHHQFKLLPGANAESPDNITVDFVSNFIAPEVIHDLTNQRTLYLSPDKWSMIAQRTGYGTPSTFFWDQQSIWFDVAPDSDIVYEMEYRRVPPALAATTDEPQIPEPWHTPVIYWALHEVYRRHQESTEAWAVKQDLNDMMRQILTPDELVYDKMDGIMEVSRYGDNN